MTMLEDMFAKLSKRKRLSQEQEKLNDKTWRLVCTCWWVGGI